jgi:plasmid stabilization system protein ParE
MTSSYAEQPAISHPPLDGELPSRLPDHKAEDVLAYHFRRIDPKVAVSFTRDQRNALRSILAMRKIARHAIEVRRTMRVGRHRYYLLFLAGRERRAYEGALPQSRKRRPALHIGSVAFGLVAAFVVATALKHLIGFDIIP